MTDPRASRRARPALRLWCAVLLFLAGAPAAALAQVPDTVPRDTTRRDTVQLPAGGPTTPDTVPTQATAAQDTAAADTAVGPAPNLPAFPQPTTVGWAAGRWSWDRDELMRYHGLSLLELLERVPGLVVTRTGGYGRPAGITTLGLGGGRVRLFLDGYEIDPLGTATPELQAIGLVDLDAVRVERSLHGVRIDLSTFRLPDSRAYSQVEAGTGNGEVKMLRALFARTYGQRGTLQGGFDLNSLGGFNFREPFTTSAGRLRFSYLLNPSTGLQLDFVQSRVQRESEPFPEGFPEEVRRRDLVLRGRAEPRPGLVVEAMLGQSTYRDTARLELSRVQTAVRAAYDLPFGGVEAVARLRPGGVQGVAAPASDLSLRASLQPLGWLGAELSARLAAGGDATGTELQGTVRAALPYGLSAFGTLAVGSRGVGLVRDTTFRVLNPDTAFDQPDSLQVDEVYFPGAIGAEAGGVRAGVEWARYGAVAGGALLALPGGDVAPFGLRFDRNIGPVAVEAVTGVEGYFVVPLPILRNTVQVDGWYQRFGEIGARPYLPKEQGRLALQIHGLFVEGQFEPTLRLELVRRGSALVPGLEGTEYSAASLPYNLVNTSLQLRILDLRAFVSFENLLDNAEAADLPGRRLPGPRLFYGIRWHFRN